MQIRLSPTVKRLLIFYIAAFVVQQTIDQFFGGNLRTWLALIPSLVLQGRVWQIFTYSFLHADVMHLVLNCMVFAFVGSDIEAVWGTRKFLTYYFFCTLLAGLFYLIVQLLMWNPLYLSIPMVGASGGIYGLLVAYGVLFADRQLLFMMLFPVRAKQFVWLLAGMEFLQALFSGQGGLGAFAHLSGMGAGYLFLFIQAKGILAGRAFSAKSKKKPNHLRLIKSDRDNEDARNGPENVALKVAPLNQSRVRPRPKLRHKVDSREVSLDYSSPRNQFVVYRYPAKIRAPSSPQEARGVAIWVSDTPIYKIKSYIRLSDTLVCGIFFAMSLLIDGIQEKKFDVRMLEKNLVRNMVSDKEAKAHVESLPDDAENAVFINLDEIAEQKNK